MHSHYHTIADFDGTPKRVPLNDDPHGYDPAIEDGWEFSHYIITGTSDLTRIVLESAGQMRLGGAA